MAERKPLVLNTTNGTIEQLPSADTLEGTILHKFDATTAPTTGDDNGDGYAVGSIWIDVTGDAAYICVDASTAAAVWNQIDGGGSGGVQNNFSATTNPSATDDTGSGYEVGSLWVNTSTNDSWICMDATSTAAVWTQINQSELTLEDFPVGLVLIDIIDYDDTASASDPVNITGYDNIIVEIVGVTFGAGEAEINLSDDGGSTYYDTSGNYKRGAMYTAGDESNTNATGFRLNNGAKSGAHGYIEISNLNSTDGVLARGMTSGMAGVEGVGWFYFNTSGGPFDYIRVRNASSNNSTAGIIRIWGVVAPVAPQVQPTIETGTTYSTVSGDFAGNVIRRMNHASGVTVTIEPSMTNKQPLTFIQTGAGQITFAEGTGVTIESADGKLKTRVQYSGATLIPDLDTANLYYLLGDITS